MRLMGLPHKNFPSFHQNNGMDQNLLFGLIVVALVGFAVYSYFPRLRSGGLPGFEGFADGSSGKKDKKDRKGMNTPGPNGSAGGTAMHTTGDAATGAPAAAKPAGGDTFSDYASFSGDAGMGGVPMSGGQKPAGCFPREQLSPSELLPADPNSQWAQVNPTGTGDLQGKSFLSAGALIGVNSIGQSMRNSNLQLRAEIPNPIMSGISPWNISTIEPDISRRPLE